MLYCSTIRPCGAITRVVRSSSGRVLSPEASRASTNSNKAKKRRLKMSRRVKFMASQMPTNTLAIGPRRRGSFMLVHSECVGMRTA